MEKKREKEGEWLSNGRVRKPGIELLALPLNIPLFDGFFLLNTRHAIY